MTATEELRRMLDERGVEYRTYGTTDRTWFEVGNISWFVIERENGNLTADAVFLTPEQAIAATLGSCNCSNSERTTTVDETDRISISWQDGRHVTIHVMECSECGHTYEHVNGDYEFCPHCGRRVVEVNA